MKVKSVSALLVAIVATGFAASQASGATTWTVDKTTGTNNCAGNICKTISKAVQKAVAGDTIVVHPGLYKESVLVNKKLTIKASRTAPDLLSCNDNRTDPDPTKFAVLQVEVAGDPNVPGFDLEASGITIQGFIIQGADNGAGGGPLGAGSGIFMAPQFSGDTIKSNLVQDNSIGLYLGSNGTTTVNGNCFRDNNASFGVGASAGNGIYSDMGVKSATISQNHFWDNQSDDIVLTGADFPPIVQTVTVSGNQSDSSAGFITVISSNKVTVSGNIIKNSSDGSADFSAAILFWGANTAFSIKSNIVQNGAGSGIVFDNVAGAFCGGAGGCGGFYDFPNTGGTVSSNIVQSMGHDGLYAADTGATFSGANALEKTVVSSNIFTSEGDDGIHIAKQTFAALTTTTKNTFTSNIATNNPVHDCHDSNNKDVWTGNTNIGHRVNKTGLCFPGDVVTGPQNHPSS
jgi:parallel beta-helix repeat protein